MSRRKAPRKPRRIAASALVPTAPADPPPVRDLVRLEERWSPQPLIWQWLSQTDGELLWPQLDAARKQAQLGLTENWATIVDRFLATDDHIVSTYLTYINPIAGARRELVPAKTDAAYAQIAKEQAAACERLLDNLPSVEQSFAELLHADVLGWGIAEILWATRGDWVVATDLVWMHPARFRFSQRFVPFLWDRGVAAQRARELGFEGTALDGLGLPLPENKYIVHLPRILPNYPMLSGLALDLMRPWFVKNWCMKFALAGAEVGGNPRMVGYLSEHAPDAVRQVLFEALASLSADSTGVVTGGAKIEILDPKMEGVGSIFDMLIKRCDAGISKVMLGSTLNVEVGDTGGNRSLGESQADTTIAPRWARSAKSLANTIERQLLRPYLELNRHHWSGHVLVPTLKLHVSDEDPNVDDTCVNAGAVTYDDIRRSRKLEPWGEERGGNVRVPPQTQPADATIYKADLDAKTAQPATTDQASQATAAGTSLQGMLASVKDGTLAPEAAVIAIRVAFPTVSEQDAIDMVKAQSGPTPVAHAEAPGGASPRPFSAARSDRLAALSARLR